MSRVFKLAVIPVREPGFDATPSDDLAIEQVFIANPSGTAVFQYWRQVSRGFIDIQPFKLPWATLAAPLTAADVVDTTHWGHKVIRPHFLALAMAASRALPGMAGDTVYDGLVFVPYPGRGPMIPDPAQPGGPPIQSEIEGGAYDNVKPTAICPAGTPGHYHAFHIHEVGHVLGLHESEGIFQWKGESWDGGYGDPMDIMTAQGWFGGDPTHAAPVVANWPNAFAHTQTGPAPSLAMMHLWDKDYLPDGAIKVLVVADDATPSFRLNAAYGDRVSSLLAIVPPGGEVDLDGSPVGRLYLEYRDRRGWDLGFDKPGATRARTSVVAHVVQAVPNRGVRACYMGQIFVPIEVDSDLQVPGTPYTVRVGQVGDGFVSVKVTRSSPRGFQVEANVSGSAVHVDPNTLATRVTPCGDRVRWGNWSTETTGSFVPLAWGYGGAGLDLFGPAAPVPAGVPPPALPGPAVTLAWLVGGQPVPESTAGTLPSCVCPEGVFSVRFELDLQTRRLKLVSGLGDRFTMPVRAILTDLALNQTASVDSAFAAKGSYVGYPPLDLGKIVRCVAQQASQLRIDPDTLKLPDGSGPRPNWLGDFNRKLDELQLAHPQSLDVLKRLRDLGDLMVAPPAPG
jgi:hypothetical protein